MQPPPLQPESLPLREARARFFAENGFDPERVYASRWFRVETWPVPVYLPNPKARVAAVKLHDLHHIVAGYRTDWAGEAQIGAWEVGSGCGRYWAAWFLNTGALAIGLVRAPRRTFRAFVRGRRTRNLYGGEFRDALLDETVGGMRRRLALDGPEPAVTAADRAAFAGWAAVSVAGHLALQVPGLAVAYLALRALLHLVR